MAGTEIDQVTANRSYPIPNRTNNLDFDVARLRAALNAIDGDIADVIVALAMAAPLANPILTGQPKAPTPLQGDNSTRLATTAYVDAAVGGADLSGYAKLDSPNLTGSPTAPTPPENANDAKLAPTAYVDRAIATLKGTANGSFDTLGKLMDGVLLRQKVSDVNDNAGAKNEIINGDFDFWQRLEYFGFTTGSWVAPVTNYFGADRWQATSTGTGGQGTMSRQPFPAGQTDVPGNPTAFLRWQITSAAFGQTAGSCYIQQKMENVRRASGKKRTITLYMKGTGTLPSLYLVQNFGAGGSAQNVIVLQSAVVLQSGWTKYQYVVDVPSVAGKTIGQNNYMAFGIQVPINSTYTLDLAHVSVTRGDTSGQDDCFPALDYTAEEDKCRRFFRYVPMNVIWMASTGGIQHTYSVMLPEPMRAVPVVGAIVYDPSGTPSNINNAGQNIVFVSRESVSLQVMSQNAGYVQVSGYRFPLDAEI